MKSILILAAGLFVLVQCSCATSEEVLRLSHPFPTYETPFSPMEISTENGYVNAEIYFKVQVGAFLAPLDAQHPFLKNISPYELQIDSTDMGLHSYSVGYYKTYEAAANKERLLKKQGYPHAFVAAYTNEDVRINDYMADILVSYRHGY